MLNPAPSPPAPTRRAVLAGGAAALVGGTLLAGCRPTPGRDPTPATTAPQNESSATALAGGPAVTGDVELFTALRLTYGLVPGLVEEVRAVGRNRWVEAQLAARTPDSLTAAIPGLDVDATALASDDQTTRARAAMALRRATLRRQVHSPAQLYEQMVELWSNHFSIFLLDGPQRVLKLADDRDVIRPHAMGRFADLLVASAQSPAMLVYLDNATSVRGAINENYGRELLELHTVGVHGGYSEADVVAVANVLTGWGIARPRQGGAYRFAPAAHDERSQRVMGWTTPPTATGEAQGRSLLDYLAHHPSTAHYLAAKLVTRFVSDEPDAGLVDAVAAAYLAADTDITATLRALFADERSHSTATLKVRRPEEFLVAAIRGIGAEVEGGELAPLAARQLNAALERLGQPPFGWPAPNGYPDVAGAWSNAGGLLARWNTAGDLVAGRIPGLHPAPAARTPTATGGDLLTTLSGHLLGGPLDDARAAAVRAALDNAGPTRPQDLATALLLSSPEFQYR